MDYTRIRKGFLKVFIGFLGLTALVAIISVVRNEYGEFQMKVLATCFSISAASICSMACTAFIEKSRRSEFGLTGIGMSVLAAAMSILALWAELDSRDYIRATFTAIIAAVALAHSFLLNLPTLARPYRWVQWAATMLIGLLSMLLFGIIWLDVEMAWYHRSIAVVSILVGLVTLVVPILMKMSAGAQEEQGESENRLILEHVSDNRFRDLEGRLYRVEPDHSND